MTSSFWQRKKQKVQDTVDNFMGNLESLPMSLQKNVKHLGTILTKGIDSKSTTVNRTSTQAADNQNSTSSDMEFCKKHIKAAYYKMVADVEKFKASLEYSSDVFDEDIAMVKYSQDLDNRHCPECHYDFGKPLSRGKECPNCHQALRVRNFRIVGPTYLNKLDSIIQPWRKYFKASIAMEQFECYIKFNIPIDPMEALSKIAQVYERLEDYDKAWHAFSGINVPTIEIWSIWTTAKKEAGECSDDDMLYIEFWRAEFLDRRYSTKTWNTKLEEVVNAYIEVITKARDLRVSFQCDNVLKSITKLSALYHEPENRTMVKKMLENNNILDKIN